VIIRESDYPWDEAPYGDPQGTDFNNDMDFNDTNLPPGDPLLQPGETSDLFGYRMHDPWESQFGDFESFGVDVSLDWMFTRKDLVSLSLAYLDNEWVDATDAYYWKGYFTRVPEMGTEGRTYNGLRNTYSPEWSVSARYEHRFDLGSFGTLIPEIDLQYKSDYDLNFREEFFPFNYQESNIVWNASLGFNHSSDRWSLRAYIKNIDKYAAKLFWQQWPPGSTPILGVSDPRLYGVVLSVNY